jgi:hypothetical protein
MGVFIAASLLRAPEPLVNANYSRSNEPAVNARITAKPQLAIAERLVQPAAFGYVPALNCRTADHPIWIHQYEEIVRHPPSICVPPRKKRKPDRIGDLSRLKVGTDGWMRWIIHHRSAWHDCRNRQSEVCGAALSAFGDGIHQQGTHLQHPRGAHALIQPRAAPTGTRSPLHAASLTIGVAFRAVCDTNGMILRRAHRQFLVPGTHGALNDSTQPPFT